MNVRCCSVDEIQAVVWSHPDGPWGLDRKEWSAIESAGWGVHCAARYPTVGQSEGSLI